MKKLKRTILATVSIAAIIIGCTGTNKNSNIISFDDIERFEDLTNGQRQALEDELRLSFDFFWTQANTNPNSPGFGLIPDRWNLLTGSVGYSSTAATGFGLATIAVGVDEGFITFQEGEARVYGTVRTLHDLQTNGNSAHQGVFYHFLDMQTGLRSSGWNDASTIDTALLVAGMMTAGEFFGGRIKETVQLIYSRINWAYFVNDYHPNSRWNGRQFVSMGFRSDSNSNPDRPGLLSNWDWYAEQIILYILAAGTPNPDFRIDERPFYQMNRPAGQWGEGNKFIYSFFNSIFTHQFTHAFVDFRGTRDRSGIDWYQNSVDASLASWQWTIDNKNRSKSFSEVSWGLSASDWSGGYSGYLGTPPRGWNPDSGYSLVEGTVNTQGALSSIIFTPAQSVHALMYYRSIPELQGRFGLMGAFDLDKNWFSTDIIGIDKGITALMFSNFRNGLVQKYFMQSDAAIGGMERLGITQ